jgi:TRAP transporter TAXI family solute receptor
VEKRQLILMGIVVMLAALLLSACSGGNAPASGDWKWPNVVYVTASGQSGMAKFASWATIMEADTGLAIRIVPENSPVKETLNIRQGKMLLGSGSKSAYRNVVEATEDMAIRDGGAYKVSIVWVNDLAHSGFFVRGDSSIKTLADVKKGTRFAVWDMKESTLNPTKSLLAWLQLDPKDVVWVNAGSYDGAMRAVAEGRADMVFCFPTSPAVFEAASAPQGIRFIDLDAKADPAGAKRWQAVNRLYSFGPIAAGAPPAIGRWGTVGYISIVTRAESDPELIYRFAKWLDTNYERYKGTYSSNVFMTLDHLMENLNTIYFPVHEGLIRFLKEKGKWTPDHDKRQQKNIALLTTYEKAYAAAIALADQKKIAVEPSNKAWVELWEKYKIDNKIPYVTMHVNLTTDAPVILYGQEQVMPAAPGEGTGTPAPPPAPVTTAPSASGIKFDFLSVTKSAGPNDPVQVVAQTEPNAECTIDFFYSNGDKSNLIFPAPNNVKKADSSGKVQFDGVMYRQVRTGAATVEVTVKSGDKTGAFKATLEVMAASVGGQATPAPTPSPAPAPAPAPSTSAIKFEFTSVTKSAGPNAPVQVIAQTEPNAECTIDFFYSNGNKSSLVFPSPGNVKKADASGKVQFDGAMYRQVTTGPATIQVTVNSSGKTGVFKTTMEVTAV